MDNNINIQTERDLDQPKEQKMTFNTIFSILLLCTSFSSLILSLASFFSGQPYIIAYAVVELFVFAFCGATGITLLERKKIGYVLAMTYNIISCIMSVIVLAIGSFFSVMSVIETTGEYEGLAVMIAVIVIVFLLIPTAYHVFSLHYYKKRKHLFNN